MRLTSPSAPARLFSSLLRRTELVVAVVVAVLIAVLQPAPPAGAASADGGSGTSTVVPASSATPPLPTPPGGGAPWASASGGWQDGQALLRSLDLRDKAPLDEDSLYVLARNGAAVWEPTAISAVVSTDAKTVFSVTLSDAGSGHSKVEVFHWNGGGNNGAGSLTVTGPTHPQASIDSAAFVYDGTTTRLGLKLSDGDFLLVPAEPHAIVGSDALPMTLPAMLGGYLGYQQVPPDLTVLGTKPAGFTIDPNAIYSVFTFSVVTGSAAASTSSCTTGGLHHCYLVSYQGYPQGTLDVTPDLVLYTSPTGVTSRVADVALSYPLGAALPAAPMLSFVAAGRLFSVAIADPAGQALSTVLYWPLHGAAALPVDTATADVPAATPTAVSSAEYAYYVSTLGGDPTDYVVKDSYTDADLAALPSGTVPVDVADAQSWLDNGQRNYAFRAGTGAIANYFSTDRSPSLTGAGVVAVAQGYAGTPGGSWRPVLAVQRSGGGGQSAAITLFDLTTAVAEPLIARALTGPMGRVRALTSHAPLTADGVTVFAGPYAPSAVVNPASVLSVDASDVLHVTGAKALTSQGTPITLAGATVTRVGYGRLEQSGGLSSTKVFAAQLADGTVVLVSVVGGLTPAMITGLNTLFGPITARYARLAQQQADGRQDLTVTYGLAVDHGLSTQRRNFGVASAAASLEQSGKTFSFQTGQNNLTPTLASQLFDDATVRAVLADAQQDPGVLNDEAAAFATRAQLDRAGAEGGLTITGGIWNTLTPAVIAAHPELGPIIGGATNDDLAKARTVASWILQEVQATTPATEPLDTTLPPLGQDYASLVSRVTSTYPSVSTDQARRAVANAFELLGISSRQLLAEMTPANRVGCPACYRAYVYGTFARTALQPNAAAFRWQTSSDPLDLGYVGARVSDRPSFPGDATRVPTAAEAASMGRYYFATARLTAPPALTYRTAQFASRAVYNEFPLWAASLANSDATVTSVNSARQLSLMLLNYLDGPLAQSISTADARDLIAARADGLRLGELSPDQIDSSVTDVVTQILGIVRGLTRAAGLSIDWRRISDVVDAVYKSAAWPALVNRLIGLSRTGPALSATPTGLRQVVASAINSDPKLVHALNDVGLFGVATGLVAIALVGTFFGESDGKPASLQDKLMAAYDLTWVTATATHFGQLTAMVPRVARGESLVSAAAGVNRALGLNLTTAQMWRYLLGDRNYRINEIARQIWLAASVDAEGRVAVSAATVEQVLRDMGCVFGRIDLGEGHARLETLASGVATELAKLGPTTKTYATLPGSQRRAAAQSMATRRTTKVIALETGEVATEVKADTIVQDKLATGELPMLEQAVYTKSHSRSRSWPFRKPVVIELDYGMKSEKRLSGEVALDPRDAESASEDIVSELETSRDTSVSSADRAGSLSSGLASGRDEMFVKLAVPSTCIRCFGPDRVDALINEQIENKVAAVTGKADKRFVTLSAAVDARVGSWSRASVVGRVVGLALASVARLSDLVLGPLLLAYSVVELKAARNPFAQAAAGLSIAAAAPFMAAGVLALIGAEVAMVAALPLLVVAVALTAVAIMITMLVKRSPTSDSRALRAWLEPFVAAGLVRGGAAGITALIAWHTSSPGSPASMQSLPYDCDPSGLACRRSDAPGPATTRYLLRQSGSGLCASLSDYPARPAAPPSSTTAPLDRNFARLVACDAPDSDSALYVLPDIGADTDRLVSRDHRCLDNYGNTDRNGAVLVAYTCSFGDPASSWWLSTPGADGTVSVSNPGSGLCLDSDGAQVSSGTALVQGTCTGSSTQRWTLTAAPQNSYLLRNVFSSGCASIESAMSRATARLASCDAQSLDRVWTIDRLDGGKALIELADGVCLDALNDSYTADGEVVGWRCDRGDSAQWWTVSVSGSPGVVSLSRQASAGAPAVCVHLSARTDTSLIGSPLVLKRCDGSDPQRFALNPVPTRSPVQVAQAASGRCAAVNRASVGGAGMLADCAGFDDRSFSVIGLEDGSDQLTPGNGLCLAAATSGQGAPVTGVTCTDGEQGWRVSRPAADGTVTIVNPTSGRCLDTADGATAQYSALVIGDCVPSSTTQRWRMGTATPATQQLQQQASQLCATGNDGYALGDCATASGFTALTSADGTGVILSRGDGRCLTVRGALTGSLVATDLCTDGDPVSAWTQIPSGAGDGSVMLRNQSDNECLDTRYAETAAGSRLVQGPCVVGSATQRWTLR